MWHLHFGITMLCASEANDLFWWLPFSDNRYSTFVSVYEIILSHLCFGSIWYHSIHGAKCQIIFQSKKINSWMNSTSLNICVWRGAAFGWVSRIANFMGLFFVKELSSSPPVCQLLHHQFMTFFKYTIGIKYSKNSPF